MTASTTTTPSAATNNVFDLIDQAADMYFSAVKTGVKVQEDLAKSWTDLAGSKGTWDDVAKRGQKAFTDANDRIRQEAETAVKQMEANTRQSVELLRKAMEAGQAAATPKAQEKLQELWSLSLDVLKQNTETLVKSNARLLEAWARLAEQNAQTAGTRAKARS